MQKEEGGKKSKEIINGKDERGNELPGNVDTAKEQAHRPDGGNAGKKGDGDRVSESPGLSLRDAAEVALAASKTDAELAKENRAKALAEVAQGTEQPELHPPHDFNAKEIADFRALSRIGQEAQIRLYESRKAKTAEFAREGQRLKEEREKLAPYQEIATNLTPFIQAMGTDMSSPVAIQKALAAWQKFEKDAGPEAAAEYLEAKGHKDLANEIRNRAPKTSTPQADDPKISSLQKDLDTVKNSLAARDQAEVHRLVNAEFNAFESEKNAASGSKYPDIIGDGEQAQRLRSQIAHLTLGNNPASVAFIQGCKDRIPGLTFQNLLREAYRFYGGKVDESDAKPQNIKNHQRANAIQPGRGAQNGVRREAKQFDSLRDAAQAALDEIRAREG